MIEMNKEQTSQGFEKASEMMERDLQVLMDNCISNNGSAVLIDKDNLQLLIWLLSELRQKIERLEFEMELERR